MKICANCRDVCGRGCVIKGTRSATRSSNTKHSTNSRRTKSICTSTCSRQISSIRHWQSSAAQLHKVPVLRCSRCSVESPPGSSRYAVDLTWEGGAKSQGLKHTTRKYKVLRHKVGLFMSPFASWQNRLFGGFFGPSSVKRGRTHIVLA